MRRYVSIASVTLLAAVSAWAQQSIDFGAPQPMSFVEGWQAFTDLRFLGASLLTLALAAILGGMIAHHPRHRQCADTVQELDAPKVYILCAVIGAIIGILVTRYGLVVGFIIFGIGGILRFRTILRSASLTGHVIYVTLIGLACGLNLPHVAVLSTAFGIALIYVLEMRITFQIDIRGLPAHRIGAAAAAYRALHEEQDCRIVSERKNPAKERVRFVFQTLRCVDIERVKYLLESEIDPSLKGTVDWEVN
jgi:hypothetical protein